MSRRLELAKKLWYQTGNTEICGAWIGRLLFLFSMFPGISRVSELRIYSQNLNGLTRGKEDGLLELMDKLQLDLLFLSETSPNKIQKSPRSQLQSKNVQTNLRSMSSILDRAAITVYGNIIVIGDQNVKVFVLGNPPRSGNKARRVLDTSVTTADCVFEGISSSEPTYKKAGMASFLDLKSIHGLHSDSIRSRSTELII
jgi:hypothetical protein